MLRLGPTGVRKIRLLACTNTPFNSLLQPRSLPRQTADQHRLVPTSVTLQSRQAQLSHKPTVTRATNLDIPLSALTAVPGRARLARCAGPQAKEPSTVIAPSPAQHFFHSHCKTDARGQTFCTGTVPERAMKHLTRGRAQDSEPVALQQFS